MLMDLTDVSCHQAVGVMKTPRAGTAIMEFCHQAVPRNEPHQNILTEDLQRRNEEDQRLLKGMKKE